MNIENIIEIFCRLSGISAENVSGFRFLCENALMYVQSRLKPDADVTGGGSRINYAAAALAYYRYILLNVTGGDIGEIKVGDISTKSSSAKELEAADKFCRDAFEDIAEFLENNEFIFTSV